MFSQKNICPKRMRQTFLFLIQKLGFPGCVFVTLKNCPCVCQSVSGWGIYTFKSVRNAHFLVFHSAQSVVGKDFHALYVIECAYKVPCSLKRTVIVGNSRNKYVPYPYRLVCVGKISEHFLYVLSCMPGKFNMGFFVDMLYVNKKKICVFH